MNKTASHNLDLTGVILSSGVPRFFDMISLKLNDLLSSFQESYKHDSCSHSKSPLNTTRDGLPTAFYGFRHVWIWFPALEISLQRILSVLLYVWQVLVRPNLSVSATATVSSLKSLLLQWIGSLQFVFRFSFVQEIILEKGELPSFSFKS